MARYEHLPIYKQAMDVAVHFEKVAGFRELPLCGIPAYPTSRYHKVSLGTGTTPHQPRGDQPASVIRRMEGCTIRRVTLR